MSDLMLGRDVADDEIGVLTPIRLTEIVEVTFTSLELQALCPAVAGIQPDIYDATIRFRGNVSIESKSLKLWFVTFRDRRIFAEDLAIEIGNKIKSFASHLHNCVVKDVEVTLVQNIRGGIVETVHYKGQTHDQ
jgi:NADPH-dependent 7-cyano-7-deazaguanine reductase QueF